MKAPPHDLLLQGYGGVQSAAANGAIVPLHLGSGDSAYSLLLAVDNSVLWFCTFSALLLYWCVVFSWAICCFCTSFFHLF
jgi:hypothetical protein